MFLPWSNTPPAKDTGIQALGIAKRSLSARNAKLNNVKLPTDAVTDEAQQHCITTALKFVQYKASYASETALENYVQDKRL